MSVRIMSLVFDARFTDITIPVEGGETKTISASTAKFVCLALAYHCTDDGAGYRPSVDILAKETELSRRSIYNALSGLKAAGAIWYNGDSEYGLNLELFEKRKRN